MAHNGFMLSMFVDFGVYFSLMKPVKTLPNTSGRTAFAQIFLNVNTYKS